MLVDSHCHLNLLDLANHDSDLNNVLAAAKAHDVGSMLSVSVTLEDYSVLANLAQKYDNIYFSIGLHPNHQVSKEPTLEQLTSLATDHKCIAIGETGLDYYRSTEFVEPILQQQRFYTHIEASISTKKPLIIHTRQSANDTLAIMKTAKADLIGGVMHCFTEDWSVAKQAMDLNFYLSFSGIITFKNARDLQELVKKVPLEKILIETDSPYLAPVPYRGKPNQPAFVKYVALAISELKNIPYEVVAKETTANFFSCFKINSNQN